MRFVDLILVIPVLVVLIVLAHVVAEQTNNWFWLAIIIGALSWTYVARLVRADFLSLRERDFVEASRALGASDRPAASPAPAAQRRGPDHRQRHASPSPSASCFESTLSFLGPRASSRPTSPSGC